MSAPRIRVLLVDDSPLALATMRTLLASSADIEIVGTARGGHEALALIPVLRPHVVCTDLHMGDGDGVELTRAIMTRHPLPVVVVTASTDKARLVAVRAAGAVEVLPKSMQALRAATPGVGHPFARAIRDAARTHERVPERPPGLARQVPPTRSSVTRRAVVAAMGASTGGPTAFKEVLSRLPADFPLPVLCVQHITPGFLPGLVQWLDSSCAIVVKTVEPGEFPRPGTVYFPGDDAHLVVDSSGRLQCPRDVPGARQRPSVDALFQSVATFYRARAVGVLLTGMGRDGAEGLHAIARVGGATIAQDEASSLVFGMPAAAIALGAAGTVLPLHEIPAHLMTHATRDAT